MEAKKQLIKNEVTYITEMIDFEKKKAIKTAKNKAKNRVNQAYLIAENIYNKYKNIKTDEEIITIIKTALRPIFLTMIKDIFL